MNLKTRTIGSKSDLRLESFLLLLFLTIIYNNALGNKDSSHYLDLSQIDFQKLKSVAIETECDFYWNQFIETNEIQSKQPDLQVGIPDQWSNYFINEERLPIYGYGSYHFKIILNDTNSYYKLNLSHPLFPAKFIVDGEVVAQSGSFETATNSYSHEYNLSNKAFKPSKDTFDVIVHVANSEYEKGGLSFPIQFGLAKEIDNNSRSSSSINLIFIGCILLMASYHLILFMLRARDKSPLYLTLSCLGAAMLYLLLDYEMVNIIIPNIHYSSILYFSSFPYLLLYSGYFMMVFYLFPKEFPKKILYIVLFVSLFNYFFLLIAPSVALKLEQVFRILRAIAMLYSFVVVILAVVRKRDDAVMFMVGYGFLISAVVLDMLVQINALNITSPLKLGILLFFFNQAFIVARRFSSAFKQSENLAVELSTLNKSLEQKVIERTATIEKQKNDLEKLNGMKDKLFSIIGHDLRSPLASLSGVSNVVKMLLQKKRFDTLEQVSEQIDTSVNNVNNLLDNLLKWAFIQTKQTMFNLTKCDVAHLIESTVNFYKPVAEPKGIDINYSYNENAEAFLDENLMRTVLRNLISNAIKFSYENSAIQVQHIIKDSILEISVSDSGTGMNEETMQNLFVLSDKKIKTGTKNEKGTGLGLLLCKEFVEMHKGEIKVESVLNKGTTFICAIPINEN